MANAPGSRRLRSPSALAVGVALMVLIAASCGGGTARGLAKGPTTSTRAPATASKDPHALHTKQWLFAIQSSGPTTFDPATNTLAMPTAAVTAFTDRPYRDTRSTSPDVFANLWNSHAKNSFAKDPPNAVLTYWTDAAGGGVPRTSVCKVTGDVRYKSADGVLSMGLRVLEPTGATLPAHLYRASLFVDNVPSTCTISPDDETIVEYFNQLEFNQLIQIVINQTPSGSFGITLSCPEPFSATMPPPDYDLQMTPTDGSGTTNCENQTPLEVNLTQAPDYCSNTQCTFMVTALNSSTGTIYSQTELILNLTPEPNQTIDPELNPATLPICSQQPVGP